MKSNSKRRSGINCFTLMFIVGVGNLMISVVSIAISVHVLITASCTMKCNQTTEYIEDGNKAAESLRQVNQSLLLIVNEIEVTTEDLYSVFENVSSQLNEATGNAMLQIEQNSINLLKLKNELLSATANISTLQEMIYSLQVVSPSETNSNFSSSNNSTEDTSKTEKGAVISDLDGVGDAPQANCTTLNLSSCTLPTKAQYGSSVPTFWSCQTSPVNKTKESSIVQCVVTDYGDEINPVGASLSVSNAGNTQEYQCLCSVVVTTTIWRKSSVTCSIIENYCYTI